MSSERDDEGSVVMNASSPRKRFTTLFKRWYRELGGLALFLLIFYAAISWTNRSIDDEESSDVNASQMTKPRIYSESAMRRAKFDDAAFHLKDLLAADPHNSHARFRLAYCYHSQFIGIYSQLNDPLFDSSADSGKVKSLKSRQDEFAKQAAQLYQRSTKSHRYRGSALFHLAQLNGLRKDREETLKALDRLLTLNYSTTNGIARSPEFEFLLDDPEFQRLIVVEQKQQ